MERFWLLGADVPQRMYSEIGHGATVDGRGMVYGLAVSLRFRKRAAPRMLEAIEAVAPRTARCASNQFEMTVHQTAQGAKYLWIINANVAAPVTDTVTLAGRFQRGIDLDVPGGFPVPFCHDEKHTSFRLSLQPGEFTLIAFD